METITASRQLCLPFPDLPSAQESSAGQVTNHEVAELLYELSTLLREQGANPFRVRAYERAAETLRGLRQPAHEIVAEEGLAGLTRLPGIGRSLARAIDKLSRTGRLALLERIRDLNGAEKIFATVPDIGPGLAHRIHQKLGIETLADLEVAARDGRLASVEGMDIVQTWDGESLTHESAEDLIVDGQYNVAIIFPEDFRICRENFVRMSRPLMIARTSGATP